VKNQDESSLSAKQTVNEISSSSRQKLRKLHGVITICTAHLLAQCDVCSLLVVLVIEMDHIVLQRISVLPVLKLPGLSQVCNVPHAMGLYKMTGISGRALSLSARGAIADIMLWAIARIQTRLFASRTFGRCASTGHRAFGTQFQAINVSLCSCVHCGRKCDSADRGRHLD
jgi:hypothetical protein